MLRSLLISSLILLTQGATAQSIPKPSAVAEASDLAAFKPPHPSCYWSAEVRTDPKNAYQVTSCSDYVAADTRDLASLEHYCLKRGKALSPDEEKLARNRQSKWTPKKACDIKKALYGCLLQNEKVSVISWAFPTPNVTSNHVDIMKKDPAIALALLCDASKKRGPKTTVKIVLKELMK